jgi:hypothetical protein
LSSTLIFDPAGNAGAGSFTTTAPMASPRYYHTATLLLDGRVLVTGGNDNSGHLASAEIFDPAGNAGAGSFTTTASMASTRFSPTATLLVDGRVLVTGGNSDLGNLASAEIFNPVGNAGAGSFTATASMASSRFRHTATLLADGRVLVTGGVAIVSAEIFNPAGNAGAGSFTTTASMTVLRSDHNAVLLANGRVLVTGGQSNGKFIASAEIFNPAGNAGAGSFITAASMTSPRFDHAVTLLADGRVLMTGGYDGLLVLPSAEIFDPTGNAGAGSFTTTASMASPRGAHTATMLINGSVLVIGGYDNITYLSSAERFE